MAWDGWEILPVPSPGVPKPPSWNHLPEVVCTGTLKELMGHQHGHVHRTEYRGLGPGKETKKGLMTKFCLKVSGFGFVPAFICKGMRQVMAPQGLSGLCSQCQPSFSITLSLPAINFGPGSWGLVHLSLLIDTK